MATVIAERANRDGHGYVTTGSDLEAQTSVVGREIAHGHVPLNPGLSIVGGMKAKTGAMPSPS